MRLSKETYWKLVSVVMQRSVLAKQKWLGYGL